MKNICLYFQVHHPFSFQIFRFFDIGESKSYYDDLRTEKEINEAVTNYYLPTNEFLLNLIRQFNGELKLSYYISGTSLDQFLFYAPKLVTSFRQLADTGLVEFIGGTTSHSIVSLTDQKAEFKRNIKVYSERIEHYFGQKPRVFVNTDLLFSNQIAKTVAESGYSTILTNGAKKIMQWRSPNYLYSSENEEKIRILFRNEGISNELSAVLTNQNPMDRNKQLKQFYASLEAIHANEPIQNIYLNYKLLGGYDREIKQHLFRAFISHLIKCKSFSFCLPHEMSEQYGAVSEIGIEEPVCWTEHFHSSYYPGNVLQKDAIRQLFKLRKRTDHLTDPNLQMDWQYLQTSDHFHLMDENHPTYHDGWSSGIYRSKYDAFINYMNILEDFEIRLKADAKTSKKQESRSAINQSRNP